MSILIDDKHLEQRIMAVQADRGDATKTKTAKSLLAERLREIEIRQDNEEAATAPSSAAA